MKTLMPIDGSDCSEKTIAWAADTFNKPGNEFYLLMVINPIPDFEIQDCEFTVASDILEKAKKKLEAHGCKVIDSKYIVGETLPEITGTAHEIEADQVVIGSNGRTGLSKWMLGSTSIGVLEHCKCAVVIYKNPTGPA